MASSNFQSFALDDPATCVMHNEDDPLAARVIIMASPADVKAMAFLMRTVMESHDSDHSAWRTAHVLHEWLEGAFHSFTYEEQEAGHGPK